MESMSVKKLSYLLYIAFNFSYNLWITFMMYL